jgi:hypothetical protein
MWRRLWLLTALGAAGTVRASSASAVEASPGGSTDSVARAPAVAEPAGLAVAEQAAPAVAEPAAPAILALRWSGYLQIDWVVHNQASENELNLSTGAPLNQDRFTLRRGHLRADAEHGLLSGALEIDANTTNGAQLRPIDAEIAVHWPEHPSPEVPRLALSAGLMKIPFGFEVPERDVERPFLERSSVARALFPGEFDLGAQLQATYRFCSLAIALMNGHPLADRTLPALAPDRQREVVGRLGVKAVIAPSVLFEIGVSADTGVGFHPGTPTTKSQLVWRDDNGDGIVQATEVQVIAGSSATPSEQFHRFALGGDARLSWRLFPDAELALRAEIMRGSNLDRGIEPADPIGAGYDLRELGWYVGATEEVTRWVLLGVRYDHYNPDQDGYEQRAVRVVPRDRSYSTLALLAMLRYGDARLSVEYDRNHNALGRSPSGAPATLPSDALTARAQLRF